VSVSSPGPAAISSGDAQPLREVLGTPVLAGARVLAGEQGLDRCVERLNVMEVPDILPWVKPHEFLLTTAYPLRAEPDALPRLIADLDAAGLAGLGVKLGRYLEELPAAALEVADARGFPVVQLPDEVGFDEILNDVLTGILNRQAQALARSERIHKAFLQLVLRGHGLPEIARDLADLVDAPAAVVGPDGRILAGARLEELGLDQDVELLVRAGRARVGRREVAVTATPIVAGLREHGQVVAFPGADGPTADLLALENAATVAALTLTKQLEVQAVEDKYRSELMHDLVRRVDDPEDVLRRAAGFGWELDRRLIVIVLRSDATPPLLVPDELARHPPLAGIVEQAVRERDPGAAVVRFSREVVVLTAAFDGPDGRAEARAFVRGLATQAGRTTGGSISAGLSRPVERLQAIAQAYDQAGRSLDIGRQIHGDGAIAHFDDLGAYRLLSLIEDREELAEYVSEVLGDLAGDDATAQDLRRTLTALLETSGNVAEAARRLHFHYNTLRYRIDKLEGIVGPFMTDARTRLDVQLALLALEMRGVDGR
jgi:PucR family transcriptional regulator, purine catabolism regulatory protein